MIVRRMRPTDRGTVLDIERCSLVNPWSANQIDAEMMAGNGLGWVAEADGRIVGFAFFRCFPPESELLRLAVMPLWRRKGVGRSLLEAALFFLHKDSGCACCCLEVRASNLEARQLYLGMGFVQAGRRKSYYDHPVEDAVVLRRDWANMNGELQ